MEKEIQLLKPRENSFYSKFYGIIYKMIPTREKNNGLYIHVYIYIYEYICMYMTIYEYICVCM